MLYTLFLTAAACAAIVGVMILVYGTVRCITNTVGADIAASLTVLAFSAFLGGFGTFRSFWLISQLYAYMGCKITAK